MLAELFRIKFIIVVLRLITLLFAELEANNQYFAADSKTQVLDRINKEALYNSDSDSEVVQTLVTVQSLGK